MKMIKRLCIAIAVLLIIIFGGFYAITSFIDKEFVEQQVSSKLGREFKINGELTPQFNLSPTIKITDATLANASWGDKAPLAKIGEAQLSLQIIPLLSNDIQINSITLKNSEILLEKKRSKWNFDFDDVEQVVDEAEKDAEKKGQKLSVGAIDVKNVNIIVKDGKTAIYNISNLQLDSGTTVSDIHFEGVIDGTRTFLDGNINAITEISETGKVNIKDMSLVYGEYKLKANVNADIEAMKASLKNMKLAAMGYDITGNIDADLSKNTPYLSGNIELGDIDLQSMQEESKDSSEAAKSAELYSKEPLPLDVLDELNADLSVKLASLKVNDKIKFSNLTLPVKISGGVLTSKNISTGFDTAKIVADVKLSKSSSNLSLNVKDLNSADIFLDKDFSGGLTDLTANLTARGDSVHKIVGSLSGTSKMHLKNAVYSGEVKDSLLQQLFKLLAGGRTTNRAEISCIIADVNWNNGVGDLNNFGVVTDYAVVAGGGKIQLPTQKMRLILYPEARNIGLSDFLVPPIVVTGGFDNISVYPEAKGTAVSAIKAAAGIATGVGIFAKLGEVVANKSGISDSLGLTKANPCEIAEKAIEKEVEKKVMEAEKAAAATTPVITAPTSVETVPAEEVKQEPEKEIIESAPEKEAQPEVTPVPVAEETSKADEKPSEEKIIEDANKDVSDTQNSSEEPAEAEAEAE